MRTIYAMTGLTIGGALAYAIIGDWERSGKLIVTLAFVLGLAAIVSFAFVTWERNRHPMPRSESSTTKQPEYPFARSGNIILVPPSGWSPHSSTDSTFPERISPDRFVD